MRSRLLYAPDGRGALLSGNRSDDVNGELDWAVGDGLVKSADLRNFPSFSEESEDCPLSHAQNSPHVCTELHGNSIELEIRNPLRGPWKIWPEKIDTGVVTRPRILGHSIPSVTLPGLYTLVLKKSLWLVLPTYCFFSILLFMKFYPLRCKI